MWPMIVLGAIQTGSQIYSGYKQKQAAQENADLMREQGQFQQRQAYDQASRLYKQGESFIGSQTAGFAHAGVKLDKGSPLAALRESERNLQQDVSRTKQAGDTAYKRALSGASSLEQQGQDAFNASLIGGVTSFAGTLANNINIPKTNPVTTAPSGNYMQGIGKSTDSWMNTNLGLGGYNGSYTGMFGDMLKPKKNQYGPRMY